MDLSRERPSALMVAIAFAWGLAEATLFFIVPDVFLTFVAVRNGWRRALVLAPASAIGAVCGGAIMVAWSAQDPAAVLAILEKIPAISSDMIASVAERMRGNWVFAVFNGGMNPSPVPYKIFAAMVPQAGVALAPFLAVSFVTRLTRFVLSTILAAAVSGALGFLKKSTRLAILAGFWVVLYTLYWSLSPR
ncbi:MAG: hypothetical protein JO273_22215 [Methylobacteriaceae bacterium]|nr:hypothetical protein [Methylobacteriaceae bacterium]